MCDGHGLFPLIQWQFRWTSTYRIMPNIRILSKAGLQIFCSQGSSYTKCLCLKRGNKPTKNFQKRFKSLSVHLHLGLLLYAIYQNPIAKLVLQIFCSQGCSNTKCLCLKKGSNVNKKFTEYVQKLTSSSTSWSETICQILGS